MPDALLGTQYVVHAVPVQHSAAFLSSVAQYLPPSAPILSVSKGLEVGTCQVRHAYLGPRVHATALLGLGLHRL